MQAWLLLSFAILLLMLIPFAPQLIRLRIRMLQWLRWNWAVKFLESHFSLWVVVLRVILFVIAILMLYHVCVQLTA
jgi:hypothetical protein